MLEAKTLGIPLRQPGTGRRNSHSQLVDSDQRRVWSCTNCQRAVIEEPARPPLKAPSTAPVTHSKSSTSSPFKDMFRIFARKVKDDQRSSKVKQTPLTLPRGHPPRSCDVCGQPEVTSSPCRRREQAESCSGPGGSRAKYKRSASTPRPGGTDGRLQVQVQDSSASRPARRKYRLHYHSDCQSGALFEGHNGKVD